MQLHDQAQPSGPPRRETTMNEVLQAIIDYLQAPQTDYALLINGPWGCGKTYFWKNVVEPRIRRVSCDAARWRPLYASLYGCESIKDLDMQLFLASYPHLRKKWVTQLSTVGGNIVKQLAKLFTGLELPAVDLRWLVSTKNAVLCFDDLERSRLPMKEALGYINSFVEHEGVKTIILCNEGAIDDGEDKTRYSAMKEKVVGASLDFHPDLDAVFKTLIDEQKPRPEFHHFISQNAELVRHLFDKSETKNIRSLRRAISAMAVIVEALQVDSIDPHQVHKQLIYATALATFELHGRGADPDKLRKILSMDHMFVAAMSLTDHRREKSAEEKYEEDFARRYLSHLGLEEWQDAVGCPPICEFVITGILNRPALVAWARELTKTPDEREECIKKLSFAMEMEDEYFKETASHVLKDIEAGEIADIGKYVGLHKLFESFADEGLIAMTRQEVLQKFSDGLARAQANGRLEHNEFLEHEIFFPEMISHTAEGQTLRQRILATNQTILERGIQARIGSLASRRKEDPQGFITALASQEGMQLLFKPVFHEFDANDAAEWILALPNNLKTYFARVLHERYESHGPRAAFLVELPALKGIVDFLKAHCDGRKPVPMSLHVVRLIVGALDRAIERLEKLEKPKQEEAPPLSVPAEDQPGKIEDAN